MGTYALFHSGEMGQEKGNCEEQKAETRSPRRTSKDSNIESSEPITGLQKKGTNYAGPDMPVLPMRYEFPVPSTQRASKLVLTC
jgi:hypothetical protein